MFFLSDLPFIYFKPKILLLDDDDLFLEGLVDSLREEAEVECYTDALDFINRLERVNNFLEMCLMSKKNSDESTREILHFEYNVDIFIEWIIKVYKDADFISMVFIDYMMPNMNGLECCEKLGHTDYSKILLTASLDDQDVIRSFNLKRIDSFIKKTESNLVEILKEQIVFNHSIFLRKINTHIRQVFCCDYELPKIYKSICFQKFFSKFMEEKNIQFYFSYESKGSLLMIDKSSNSFLLNIYEKSEIEDFIFCSQEFENLLSDINRERCMKLDIVVDYKNPYNLSQGLEKMNFMLKDIATVIDHEDSAYYIVLSEI